MTAENPLLKTQDLLKEQRGIICGRLGHDWRFVLPLQIREETREVLVGCKTCGGKRWSVLPEEGYKRLLEDNAAGRLRLADTRH